MDITICREAPSGELISASIAEALCALCRIWSMRGPCPWKVTQAAGQLRARQRGASAPSNPIRSFSTSESLCVFTLS